MRLALLLVVLLLAGCAAPPPSDPYAKRKPDGSTSESTTIPHQQVFSSPPFGTPGRAIHARVTWNASAPVDAWIANGSECPNYGTHAFRPAASLLNSTGGVMSADLPAGVSSCLLVDNTDYAEGRAPAGPPVNLSYTIDVWLR